MRQIVLDTETTGLDPLQGHRVIEIGCLELVNRRLTGRQFHVYLNPEREVEHGAFKVHGISDEFLADKPLFHQISDEFMAFIKGSELIIHNAPFDIGFLKAELQRISWPKPIHDYCEVLDTLVLAKQKHPGQRNNLDALCKRYGVNNSNRELHGALLDAELLAFVYLAMTGGQIDLFAIESENPTESPADSDGILTDLNAPSLVQNATAEELQAHEAFIAWMKSLQR
jgi:DNA polymerase-3 subunit epsilon